MHSNYRHHHYLLSTANPASTQATAAPDVSQSSQSQSSASSSAGTSLSLSSSSSSPSTPTSLSQNKLRQQFQQQQVHLASSPASYVNGLPTAPIQHTANLCKSKASTSNRRRQQISPPYSSSNCTHLASTQDALDQLVGAQRQSNGNSRYFMDNQQHLSLQPSSQVHRQPMQLRSTSRDYCYEGMPLDIPSGQRAKQQQFINNSTNTNNNNLDTQAILNKRQLEYLQQQQQQQQHRRFEGEFSRHENQDLEGEDELDERPNVDDGLGPFNQHKYSSQQDNYTSQIRNSQLQQRFQQQSKIQSGANSTASMSHHHHNQQQQHHHHHHQLKNNSHQQQAPYQQQQQQQYRNSAGTSGCGSKLRPQSPTSSSSASPQSPSSASVSASSTAPTNQQQQSCKKSSVPLHVNFNRSNQAAGGDEEEGDSRKKKYLTAKYGQQQMNLIKKRLKIEMWLFEQLQELAKGSKSEVSLQLV